MRRFFSEGGGSGILRLGRHKCTWHRHRTGLTGERLFETFETPRARFPPRKPTAAGAIGGVSGSPTMTRTQISERKIWRQRGGRRLSWVCVEAAAAEGAAWVR